MIKIDVKASCEKIKDRMEKSNITAKQLQEQLGVTVTAPYVWIRGDGLPKLETLLNLCELLHCTIADLIVVHNSDSVDLNDSEPTLLNQHYYNKANRKECWDEMIEISPAGTAIFDLWNAYKYLYRCGGKADNSKEQDLKKAQNYIDHAKMLQEKYDAYMDYQTNLYFRSMLVALTNIQEKIGDSSDGCEN